MEHFWWLLHTYCTLCLGKCFVKVAPDTDLGIEKMIEEAYLIALLIQVVGCGWAISVKAYNEINCDFVFFFDTKLYSIFALVIPIFALIVSFIINWINVSFLSTLCYLGIVVGAGVVDGLLVAPLLNIVFGYSGIGAFLPFIASIASTVYLFIAQFS